MGVVINAKTTGPTGSADNGQPQVAMHRNCHVFCIGRLTYVGRPKGLLSTLPEFWLAVDL